MGSESSKLEAPDEFGQTGNQFQIISPVSDISCPSDIHRINRIRLEQRKAHPSDPSRRISRTITKTLHQPKHRPSTRSEDVPPPSHFYFPTKETERAVERAERRCQQSGKEIERPAMILKKTKKILQKTQKAMAGCFAEDQVAQMEIEQRKEEIKHHPTLGIARKILPRKGHNVNECDVKASYKAMDDPSVTPVDERRDAKPLRRQKSAAVLDSEAKQERDSRPLLDSSRKPASFDAVLHQADDYFTRLAGGSPESSPYVENKVMQALPNVLGSDEPDSPISSLFEHKESQSVLSRTVDSIIESSLVESDIKGKRHSISRSTQPGYGEELGYFSPTDSKLEYQQAIGTVAATPGYYPDDDDDDDTVPVFSDEAPDDFKDGDPSLNVEKNRKGVTFASEERALVPVSHHLVSKPTTIADKVDDESPALGCVGGELNTKSAFRPRTSMQSTTTQQTITVLASYEPSQRKVSKLESLFRPVLPSMSADDAHATTGYDHWEIKFTESAPSVIETTDYRAIATNRRNSSPEEIHLASLERKLRNGFSPTMMSMDSQCDESSAVTKDTVSKQADYNSEFLFESDRQQPKLLKAESDIGSETVSINTSGARSRLSNRTGAQAVVIVPKNASSNEDQHSRESSRRVRFSLLDAVSGSVSLAPKESIDVPTIESKLSDLTDTMLHSSSEGSKKSTDPLEKPSSFESMTTSNKEEQFNSPYLRFQSAKTKFESQTTAVVEIPEIQNKVSDLTDDVGDYKGRASLGSAKSLPETVLEVQESETPSDKSQMQVHWSYSVKDGNLQAVTPYFGKDAKNTTKSPYLRFENAKNKFNGKSTKEVSAKPNSNSSALVKKETAIVKKETAIVKKETAIVKKETAIVKRDFSFDKRDVPYKSPRSARAKQTFRRPLQFTSGGSVASRVQELNQRVVEARIDRKKHRWTKSNPRKYGVIDSNAVRTRAIVQYKTNVIGLDRINYMSAAKFNAIPIDDDSSVESSLAGSFSKKSVTFAEPRPLLGVTSSEHNEADDGHDDTDDWSKLTADTCSVATLRRDQSVANHVFPANRVSEGTYSTASSGFTNVKKQVFRGSTSITTNSSRQSLSSSGESTTMSSILDKENSNYLPFRTNVNTVKPTEQAIVVKPNFDSTSTQNTPLRAQKWRTLAAAAHLRDSEKKATRKGGLTIKNCNRLTVAP